MRELGVEGAYRRRYRRTTVADEHAAAAPDLVRRAFRARRPDQLWVADITYVRTTHTIFLLHSGPPGGPMNAAHSELTSARLPVFNGAHDDRLPSMWPPREPAKTQIH